MFDVAIPSPSRRASTNAPLAFPVLFLLLVSLLASCDDSSDPTPTAATPVATTPSAAADSALLDFVLSPVDGSDLIIAEQHDDQDRVTARGMLKNGLRQGNWAYYVDGGHQPIRTEAYVDGKLNGAQIRFDRYGRVFKYSYYVNGELDGKYAEFRAGIIQQSATYRKGKLHGTLRIHTLQNGKVNRSIEYKDGVEDGPMRWYNDAGDLIQERMYKNGELVE